MMEKENLENQLERTSFSHAEEKIKLESTLAQQTKLIDFLQKKEWLMIEISLQLPRRRIR